MSAGILDLGNINKQPARLESVDIANSPQPAKAPNAKFTDVLMQLLSNNRKNISSSDKPIKRNIPDLSNKWQQWLKLIHWADHYSCLSNIIASGLGAFSMLTGLPTVVKQKIETAVNFITTLSYVPYGLSGMNQGIEKKNIFQLIGFAGEAIMPWFGNLKDIYLIRGLDAGINQVWEYCDRNSSGKYKDGYFPNYLEGAKETMAICLKLFKESVLNPITSISPVKYDTTEKRWNFDPSGHNGLISSLLDIVSSVGYLSTGKEKLFGPIRDLGSALFDFELACQNNIKKRSAGILFIIESTFDFIARYLDNNNTRLFVNMLSHAVGRVALMLYKNSDKAAEAITQPDK
ncbi:MAG: hypothetical protein O3C63_02615 [Cyanobacteria bacterium]|nr:hypothetical protein [Cyanobacteriota bacterium]MDA1020790.1 hypothetical protein [Cyanobacteriota bacterium]